MKRPQGIFSASCGLWLGLLGFGLVAASPVRSQSADPPAPALNAAPISTRAADLIIPARAGAGYSTSGSGYDGFGSFEGFIPLAQTPGQDLWYLVGRLLLDNEAQLGGNLLVGYRTYQSPANTIYGAYLGYDTRSTGNNTFSQLGLGFEALGDGWDARINGYIPVGSTRQTVAEQLFDLGRQLGDFRFEGNFLRASGTQQQQRIRTVEVAMAGFDLEGGGRLLRFGNGGELRGYAGLYYLSGAENSAGIRGRLEARPLDYLTMGVAVQHDSIFGTNVVGTIALSFPGSRPRGADPAMVQARLGEMPYRMNAIAVDTRTEVSFTSSPILDAILTNPATGQPYLFQHVVLGAAGGNGTIESPFGVVQLALNATRSDGNDIVYVRAGTNPGIPAFTIPDRVQVLSTGPIQTLPAIVAGQFFPAYVLPESGTGLLPTVTGTVTMRSDTVLSGFNLASSTGAGITFSNVNRVDIRDNVIQNTAGAGILGNAAAQMLVRNTRIQGTGGAGISGTSITQMTVQDTAIANTAGAGIVVNTAAQMLVRNTQIQGTGGAGISGTSITQMTVQDTAIANTAGAGIVGNTVEIANLFRNTITSAQDQGIYLQTVGTANITDTRITGIRAGTTTLTNPVTGDINLGGITIPNLGSLIPLPSGQGIVITNATNGVNLTRNTLSNTGTQGVVVLNARGPVAITDNSIANTVGALFPVTLPTFGTFQEPTGQGIVVAGVNGALEVSRNTLTTLNGTAIAIAGVTNGTTTADRNTIRGAVDQGLLVLGTTGGTTLSNNQISDIAARLETLTVPILGTLTLSTGQGITLINPTGTVDVSGNVIERVNGARVGADLPFIPGGQGIQVVSLAGQVALTLTNNQIRNNDNDGMLMLFAGRPTATTTASTATVRIAGNTIENNGGNTPIRGDGIAIAVDQDAIVNNLVIENNIIRQHGDEGIDIRLGLLTVPVQNPTTARLTGTIQNNTISNNAQNGVQVQATASTTAQVAMTQNTVSNNGQRGVFLTTTNLNQANIPTLGNPSLTADVQLNVMTGNTGVGIDVATTTQPLGQRICVNLRNNQSSTPIRLFNTPNFPQANVLSVVDLANVSANNNGATITPSVVPPPTTIPVCP